MSTHNIHDQLRRGEFPETWRGISPPAGKILAFGVADPADQGYAKGCLLVNTNDGTFKHNTGTAAGATWTALGGGAAGEATSLADGCTLTSTGNDPVLAFAAQTGAAATLTIPDFNAVSDTFLFATLAATLKNKTLWDDTCKFVDATAVTKIAEFDCSGIAAGQTRVFTFPNYDGTLATVGGTETLTAKTLTTPTINGAALTVASAGAYHMGIDCGNALAAADRLLTITLDSDAAHGFSTPEGTTDARLIGTPVADSGTEGDVLYFDGTTWKALGVGVSGQAFVTAGAAAPPYWGAPSFTEASQLTNTVTCEAGGSDYTLDFGAAGGARTLTIPAVAGSRTFAFIDEAQTFADVQTFEYGMLEINDNVDAYQLTINWEENDGAADRALDFKVNSGDRVIDLTGDLTLAADLTTVAGAVTITAPGAGVAITLTGDFVRVGAHSLQITTGGACTVTFPDTGTMATLAGGETLTNKTLTSAVLTTPQINDTSLDHQYIFVASELAADRNVTLPLLGGADEFVFKDHAVTLTNKTVDADSNVFSNFNGDEMDPVTTPATQAMVTSIPILLWCHVSDEGGGAVKMTDSSPYKLKVIDAWAVNTSADGGTWKLQDNASGDITDNVTAAATDNLVSRPAQIIDATWEIDATHDLYVLPSAGLDAYIFVLAVRVD